jgi:hypothetical protein
MSTKPGAKKISMNRQGSENPAKQTDGVEGVQVGLEEKVA